VCSRRIGSPCSTRKNGAFFLVEQELPILLEYTSSPPFFLVEQVLPILLEHTSSPPFFLGEQELLEKREVNWCAPEG
jgi:hypothetical protein